MRRRESDEDCRKTCKGKYLTYVDRSVASALCVVNKMHILILATGSLLLFSMQFRFWV